MLCLEALVLVLSRGDTTSYLVFFFPVTLVYYCYSASLQIWRGLLFLKKNPLLSARARRETCVEEKNFPRKTCPNHIIVYLAKMSFFRCE